MSRPVDIVKLEFRYRRLPADDKIKLLKRLSGRLEDVSDIIFAYAHGSFVERDSFRDLDVAIWIRNPDEAFHYTVTFSTELTVEIGVPVDVQVLNKAPLPFKHCIFTRGELLISRDENLRLRLVDEVIRQYMDLKQLRRFCS